MMGKGFEDALTSMIQFISVCCGISWQQTHFWNYMEQWNTTPTSRILGYGLKKEFENKGNEFKAA